jgi:phosphate transport system substrate-binding protein
MPERDLVWRTLAMDFSGFLGGTLRSARLAAVVLLVIVSGCIQSQSSNPAGNGVGTAPDLGASTSNAALAGTISIEGSSTVYPISQAMGIEFGEEHPEMQVAVAGNGTGSGFKKFINREVEICDASRPIAAAEIRACEEKGIRYVELQVAVDGLTVAVNLANDWAATLTIEQLHRVWDQGSTVTKWSDLDPDWPNQDIELFGPGTESGTFNYFNEVVNGDALRSRSDYSSNENDNVLVDGIKNNKYALGYFGFAYYAAAQDSLKAVKIAAKKGDEGVAPSRETIEDGSYTPLSRPLFIYVNRDELQRPEVAAFATFYLSDEGQKIVTIRKYIPLDLEKLEAMRQRLAEALAK